MRRFWFGLAIVLIVLTAIGLRVYRLAPPPALDDYSADPVAQLPPGLHSDEAYDALAALRVLRSRELAPYSTVDQGRAVAHIYLSALVIAVAGPVAEASRIASVIAGLMSIAGMAWLVQELFRPIFSAREIRCLQLIAVAQLAGTYWFVHFSRMGFDIIAVPWLMLPAMALFWRWLHAPTLRRSLLAGGGLGLVLYAYPAAYAVPVIMVFTLAAWWTRRDRRLPLRHLGLYGLAFAVIALPLAAYAIGQPELFTHRMQDTAAPTLSTLIENAGSTLWGIVGRGDGEVFYNLPGRPLLDVVQSVLAAIGLWIALRRIKQPEFLFILLWSAIMLLPGILSAWAPTFNRITGAVPGILMLVTLGGKQVYQVLTAIRWRWLAGAVVGAALLFTFGATFIDYFIRWPQATGLIYSYSVGERIQAEAVRAAPAGAEVYLTPSDRQRPIFEYLWQDQPLAKSFNGRRCAVAPRQTRQDTRWFANANEDKQRTRDRLSALYPQLAERILWVNTGTPVITELSIGPGATAQLPTAILATVGDTFRLRDYRLVGQPTRSSPLRARLLWEPLGLTPDDWTVGTYLLDAAGRIRAQDDRQFCDGSYPTSQWQIDDLISDDRVLPIPQDLPAGDYQLAIVIYRPSDNTRLPVRGPDDQPLGDTLTLGTVAVP